MVETQLCKLRGTLDLYFIYDRVFVKHTWLLIYTASQFLQEVVRACSAVWELKRWTYFSGAVFAAAGLVDVCM